MYDLWKWSTKIRLGSLLPTFLPPWGGVGRRLGITSWMNFFPARLISSFPGPTSVLVLMALPLHFYILSFLQRALYISISYLSFKGPFKFHHLLGVICWRPQSTVILLPSDFMYHIFLVPLICTVSSLGLLVTLCPYGFASTLNFKPLERRKKNKKPQIKTISLFLPGTPNST